jgi:hypothetical protein
VGWEKFVLSYGSYLLLTIFWEGRGEEKNN